MSDFDWTSFTVGININASQQVLYKAWVTRKGIEEWFLRMSEFRHSDGALLMPEEEVVQGDSYRWLWHGWPDETEEKGEILEVNGTDIIRFSFGKAGNCQVSIRPYGNEFIVQLKQDNIPDTEDGRQIWHIGCKTGWTFHLANMKSIVEGGIDLRNKDESMKDLLNK